MQEAVWGGVGHQLLPVVGGSHVVGDVLGFEEVWAELDGLLG